MVTTEKSSSNNKPRTRLAFLGRAVDKIRNPKPIASQPWGTLGLTALKQTNNIEEKPNRTVIEVLADELGPKLNRALGDQLQVDAKDPTKGAAKILELILTSKAEEIIARTSLASRASLKLLSPDVLARARNEFYSLKPEDRAEWQRAVPDITKETRARYPQLGLALTLQEKAEAPTRYIDGLAGTLYGDFQTYASHVVLTMERPVGLTTGEGVVN